MYLTSQFWSQAKQSLVLNSPTIESDAKEVRQADVMPGVGSECTKAILWA